VGRTAAPGVIDLHSHILPGLDDGARSLEDAVEIARAAAEDGIRTIAATPHVRDDYPTTADEMETALATVNAALREAGVPVDVRPGGELALDWLDRLTPDDLRRFGLGGNPRCLLVEFPYYGWPLDLPDRLFRLRAAGITPVIAHPERNTDVQAAPERLRPLVESGAYVQVTAASVDGRIGRSARRCGLQLIELELAHLLASDAHHPDLRAVGLSAAVDELGDPKLGRWLTEDVPAALLEDRPVPPRPEGGEQGGLFGRLFGRR
jgi:protein-tyrosine phosphatase